ncbi:MAG: TonB-dependent receptor [Breznakibacter sp.]
MRKTNQIGKEVLVTLVLFLSVHLAALAQNMRIGGTVTDKSAQPIPGVSVLEKGTGNGTITDVNGKFELSVSSKESILLLSFIGFESQQITIGTQTVLNITLIEENLGLDEVVVVGYGVQRKSDITGSVASVKGDALREVPAANLQQALQSRAAGLEIQKVGTTPGAGAQIRIRGERTISGSNDPLLVLDGIPYSGNINDINPDDVASVEVLKDASATAIYGSRGANGVILITTKKGKAGANTVSVNSYYGITSVAQKYDVYNAREYKAMRDEAISNGVYTNTYMPEELESIANGRETDWQDLIYEKGYVTDNNVTISGGSEKSTYSIGGGFYKETTVLPGQDFNRKSIKASNDLQVGKYLKFGLSTTNSLSTRNGSTISPMFNILALSPLMPAYDDNGEIIQTPSGNVDDQANTYSPLYLKHNDNDWVDEIKRLRTFNTFYGEVTFLKDFNYRLNVGFDYSVEKEAQFRGEDSYFRPKLGNTASVKNTEQWSYTVENIVNYTKQINDDHRVNVTGLYSVQEDIYQYNYASKDSITQDFIQYYDLGNAFKSANYTLKGDYNRSGLISYMGRVNYAFRDKYLLTATARIDGSSRLTDKWHDYYAVSTGWNIHRESFIRDLPFINILKIRAGWGETSNQSVSPYQTLGGVSNSIYNDDWSTGKELPILYNFGSSIKNGYYTRSIPSKNLVWEFTRTTNIGLDFGLFNNRINGSAEWYNSKTNNIIYSLTLPITSGYSDPYATNIGKMSNKGMEFNITSVNIDSKTNNGFRWETDLNVFWNRNKLESLYSGFERNIASGLHKGHPLSAIYDYEKLGIWQTNEADEAAVFGQVPGQIKLKDISGPDGVPDGKISPEYDRKIIGSGEAKWQGGMTNRFYFKGFDLSFVVYARVGGTIISGIHQPYASYLTIQNGLRNGLQVDYWTEDNPTNDFPKISTQTTPTTASSAWTTLGYFDATFVKVRSINLGYKIPNSAINKFGIQSARIYTTVQNPFVLYSPYMDKGGIDPEATGYGTTGFVQNGGNIPNRALTVALSTPPTRSFIFGINLTF